MPDSPSTSEPLQKTTGPLHKKLGLRIRELRSRQGFSEQEFANACGVDRDTLEHIEQGEIDLTLALLLRLALQLGMEVSAIFDGVG
ncbi:MAG TPA: helix-turn-helix transcriptional regulator [Candidatus Angelobacter sp.]|jgi:transcriptional regulator with XRE-family HTH domain|nr:helix-turn-helix transcriptional regulator [Candidatus Angelobacter sp.]